MNNWYITPSNDDILHYGILGMKWGVRRYQNADGSLTAKGRKRYLNPKKGYENLKKDLIKSGSRGYAYNKTENAYWDDSSYRKDMKNSKEYKEAANNAISIAKEIKKLDDKYWSENTTEKEALRISKELDKKYSELRKEEDKILDMEWNNFNKQKDAIINKYTDEYIKNLKINDKEVNNMIDNLKANGFFKIDIEEIQNDTGNYMDYESLSNDLTYKISEIIDDPDYYIERLNTRR